MNKLTKIFSIAAIVAGSILAITSCEDAALLADFTEDMKISFRIEDDNPLSAAPINVLIDVPIEQLDSTLKANNSERKNIRQLNLTNCNMAIDVTDSTGSFNEIKKLELYVQADSAGTQYPEILIAKIDTVIGDNVRTISLLVDPALDINKYIQAENIKFKGVIYPTNIATKSLIISTILEYKGKGVVK